jgi:ribosomal protein L31
LNDVVERYIEVEAQQMHPTHLSPTLYVDGVQAGSTFLIASSDATVSCSVTSQPHPTGRRAPKTLSPPP